MTRAYLSHRLQVAFELRDDLCQLLTLDLGLHVRLCVRPSDRSDVLIVRRTDKSDTRKGALYLRTRSSMIVPADRCLPAL